MTLDSSEEGRYLDAMPLVLAPPTPLLLPSRAEEFERPVVVQNRGSLAAERLQALLRDLTRAVRNVDNFIDRIVERVRRIFCVPG